MVALPILNFVIGDLRVLTMALVGVCLDSTIMTLQWVPLLLVKVTGRSAIPQHIDISEYFKVAKTAAVIITYVVAVLNCTAN
jgi:hypothetical protein